MFLVGCKPADPPEAPLPPVGDAAVKLQAAACAKRGGTWMGAGGESHYCATMPRDSGRHCDAKTDCQGQCLARSMTCAPVDPLLGCNDVLSADGMRTTLCLN